MCLERSGQGGESKGVRTRSGGRGTGDRGQVAQGSAGLGEDLGFHPPAEEGGSLAQADAMAHTQF